MFEKLNTLIFGLPWPLAPLSIFVFMSLVALTAYFRKHLSLSGAIAAVLLGFAVAWCLRTEGFLLFMFFYVSSNIAGRIRKARTASSREIEQKSGARDHLQVLANGLMAALAAVYWYYSASVTALVMFGAAVAEALSDTLAGEIGRLSYTKPVSIVTRRPVENGVSGGVTALGTFAGFCSSACVAILWSAFFRTDNSTIQAIFICLGGFAGCIADSLLGGFVQAVYTDKEGRYTEKAFDAEGNANALVRGLPWMDNDMVNFISNTFAVVLSTALYLVIR